MMADYKGYIIKITHSTKDNLIIGNIMKGKDYIVTMTKEDKRGALAELADTLIKIIDLAEKMREFDKEIEK